MNPGDPPFRSRYGISPEFRVSRYQIWRFAARIYFATIVSRLRDVFSSPLLKVSAGFELSLIEKACSTAEFAVARPLRVPRGYKISSLEEISGSPDVVTFVFQNDAGERWSLQQRSAWLPIEEEVTLARIPFVKAKVGGNDCYFIYGFYGGEPIDHAYWFNQLSIAFEIAGVIIELREISTKGRLTELAQFLSFVRLLMTKTD